MSIKTIGEIIGGIIVIVAYVLQHIKMEKQAAAIKTVNTNITQIINNPTFINTMPEDIKQKALTIATQSSPGLHIAHVIDLNKDTKEQFRKQMIEGDK